MPLFLAGQSHEFGRRRNFALESGRAVTEDILHQMDLAALPSRDLEVFVHGLHDAAVVIQDHKHHAQQAPSEEAQVEQ